MYRPRDRPEAGLSSVTGLNLAVCLTGTGQRRMTR